MSKLWTFILVAIAACSPPTDQTKNITLDQALEISEQHFFGMGIRVSTNDMSHIQDLSETGMLGLPSDAWNIVTYVDGKEMHVSVHKETGEIERSAIRR